MSVWWIWFNRKTILQPYTPIAYINFEHIDILQK